MSSSTRIGVLGLSEFARWNRMEENVIPRSNYMKLLIKPQGLLKCVSSCEGSWDKDWGRGSGLRVEAREWKRYIDRDKPGGASHLGAVVRKVTIEELRYST